MGRPDPKFADDHGSGPDPGVALAAMMAAHHALLVLEVLGEDYAQPPGPGPAREADRGVAPRAGQRHAAHPDRVGDALGALLGGSVAVERAFGVPGLGLALVSAVAERDWMLIQNLVLPSRHLSSSSSTW